MENTKRCSKCGRELPLECFGKSKSSKDGLKAQCKECRKQYYQTNREKILEYQNQYNAEHVEEIAEYKKQYYAEHIEEKLEHQKQYRAEHKEEIDTYNKQYYQANREEILEYKKQYDTEHKEDKAKYHAERYATIEYYAYTVRQNNLQADRKYGRCGKDEDLLPPLEYYIWALQQRDFYDGKQYHWSEMGLDRIYNDKAHTFANVVPCSTKNNRRRQKKSFEEYREYIQKQKEELELVLN